LITPTHKKYLRETKNTTGKRHKGKNIKSKKSKRGGAPARGKKEIAGRYVTFLNG
jgi:hypothetical protein